MNRRFTISLLILMVFYLAQVTPTFAQGLVAHWKFEEGEGGVAVDSVGGYMAELMETADWGGLGKIGENSLYFDGEGSYAQTDLMEDIQFSDEITVCFWFNTDITFEGQQHMFWIGDSAGNGYGPEQEFHVSINHFNYSEKIAYSFGDGLDADGMIVNIITEEDFFDAGVWHHAAAVVKVMEGDTSMITVGELYLDGEWQEPFVHEFPTLDTLYYEVMRDMWNKPMRFGVGGALGSRHFMGFLDDVQVYDVALSAEQIATVMTGETITAVEARSNTMPETYNLSQNYPNPFNPQTRITYTIPSTNLVRLKVYDMLGREVQTLVDGVQIPGQHSVTFDAEGLPGGVYLYELAIGNSFKQTKKMLLVK